MICSFDVETTGLKAQRGDVIFSYCIGQIVNGDYQVRVSRVDTKSERLNKERWDYLSEFFADTSIVKVAHNFKFELHFLHRHKIHVPMNTIWHDTMIMSQCLRNLAPSHGLGNLCHELGGYQTDVDTEVERQAKARGNYQLVDIDLMTRYQVCDGERPLLLYYLFEKELRKDTKRWNDYLVEVENAKATQYIESNGVTLHKQNMESIREMCESELENVLTDTHLRFGEFLNLNSNTVVIRLLYRKLNYPILKYTENINPLPSTDKDTLFALQTMYPEELLFDLIFKQRSYTKGIATIKSYYQHAVNTNVIYPNINSNFARTGRKSSSAPNMQNVSKDSALKNPFPVPLRKCFRPRKGYVFLAGDYAGIEMRLIINNTQEPELLDMLKKNPDADMHHPTVECFLMRSEYGTQNDTVFREGVDRAADLRDESPEDYKIQRGAYKNTGFCVAYGGSTREVSIVLAQPYETIIVGDSNYRRRFPRIADFTQTIVEEVRSRGYITTRFGRRLYVSRDKPYVGANYDIQGTAAGVMKRGQNRIWKLLQKPAYHGIRMILDVHDEILFEYPRKLLKHMEEILPEFAELMTDMPEIDVPLRVGWEMSTTNWNDGKEIVL